MECTVCPLRQGREGRTSDTDDGRGDFQSKIRLSSSSSQYQPACPTYFQSVRHLQCHIYQSLSPPSLARSLPYQTRLMHERHKSAQIGNKILYCGIRSFGSFTLWDSRNLVANISIKLRHVWQPQLMHFLQRGSLCGPNILGALVRSNWF